MHLHNFPRKNISRSHGFCVKKLKTNLLVFFGIDMYFVVKNIRFEYLIGFIIKSEVN